MVEHHRRVLEHTVLPGGPDQRHQLQRPSRRLGMARRERRRRRARRSGEPARPADLCRRHAHHHLRPDAGPWSRSTRRPARRSGRSRSRRRRAQEYSMRANHGKGVAYTRINGRGVVLVTTPAFFLHALDVADRPPARELGRRGAGRRLPEDRLDRSPEGFDRRLAALAQREADLQPEQRPAARARLHHRVVAAPRRQRRADRRQFRRAGVQPDAHRECAGRHPGL